MEKLAQNWVKNGHFPIFRPFFQIFSGGAKIHFLAIFFAYRAGGPIWGLYRAIGQPQIYVYPYVCLEIDHVSSKALSRDKGSGIW